MTSYESFIESKLQAGSAAGFEPAWLPGCLKPFQRHLLEWAIRLGRGAIFADCGLGKTLLELVAAENAARHTNKPALILAPLAVSQQTVREGEKFGVDCRRSQDGKAPADARVVVTNYERLHHFRPGDFGFVALDESQILKNFDGVRKAEITEFMRVVPYRLLATATAAPNDYWELGTSSEALGYLGWRDMITRYFKQETQKDYLGWGRTKYRFRGHAERPFWRWVCSWARVCRRPSDLGFSDEGYDLPALLETAHLVKDSTPRAGMLFSTPAVSLREQREELKVTLEQRCRAAADLISSHTRPVVTWCHLNAEADLLVRLIPDAEQVSGSMPDERKEELLLGFQSGQIRRLVIKPRIGCLGLNWQHCHDVVMFPSDSWEQYYQAVRRCWRFGQEHPVTVNVILTEGQARVMENLRRKTAQAERMFAELTAHANDAVRVDGGLVFDRKERLPRWL